MKNRTKFIEFTNNDQIYLDWVAKNPRGFVVNTSRNKRLNYRVLHSADCSYIKELKGKSTAGGFTERGYIKVCAENIIGLIRWTKIEGEPSGAFTKECGSCKPWTKSGYFQDDNS